MLQFRNITEPLVIMASIPCRCSAWWWPAHHPQFLRLHRVHGHDQPVWHRGAQRHHPHRLHQGEAQGGQHPGGVRTPGRRAQAPAIFLTTMAAAVGVTPMILSGSKLWSPLASVLAIGLIFSMFFTLLVVPVIYVLVFRRKQGSGSGAGATTVIALLGLLLVSPSLRAAEPQRITLDQASPARWNAAPACASPRPRSRKPGPSARWPAPTMFPSWKPTDLHPPEQRPHGRCRSRLPGRRTRPGPFPEHECAIRPGQEGPLHPDRDPRPAAHPAGQDPPRQ